MPIGWTPDEHDAIAAILSAHPVQSGRCFDAAQNVLPIALGRDASATPWKIKPRHGRFVVPKLGIGQRWFHHYTVEVEQHGVDALTGPSGTVWRAYLSTHWQYPDDLDCLHTGLQSEDQ
jgi:hypothetical protein